MKSEMFLASIVFFVTYILLATDRLHRTLIVLLGASFLMFSGIFHEPAAVFKEYVDFNTIFLLFGMMVFVGVLKETGIFEYVGIKALMLSKGNLLRLYFYLTTLTALTSAVLDNVTTVIVIIPITLAVADATRTDPVPFVLGEIFSSNIGGTATLVGDPPNIMIGSAAGFSFMDFVVNLGPVVLAIFLVVNSVIALVFRKQINKKVPAEKLEHLGIPISNPASFKIAVFLIGIVVGLFIFQEFLPVETSFIAILAASLALLLLNRHKVDESLSKVEWGTIIFFFGLFIVVGGLEETGFLEILARQIVSLAKGSIQTAELLILNISGFASAFVDNIPYTATLIPTIESLNKIDPVAYSNLDPLWWALSLGACLGGNGTSVGASANVVGLAILKQYYGKEISFIQFLRYGMLVLLISLFLSSLYLLLF
ncbi:MAG: citrate transporter [Thermotogae bacterium]|nr:MAG: citrate transporter [Thermotogota bacterium]RLG30106.1 MAG: citrate transporter [Methanosarcinales archaeon]